MTGGVFGDTVTYTCDAGFDLSGDVMRTCQSDGTWSGSAPMCDRKYSHYDPGQFAVPVYCSHSG